ncbi:reverse transcriptase [Caerostris darwini]|uniref:Reverse transcriptase n=1 Tax=Caerostris darwini TaxID=1538125 RepID=A0AAV4SLX1_9ARAC|nr:reverse transcriptase [Caerostris darwini]
MIWQTTWLWYHITNSCKEWTESNLAKFPLTLSTACNYITAPINNFTSKNLKDLRGNKKWKEEVEFERLCHGGCISMHLECTEAVTDFHLTTSHNYLAANLRHIGLASDGICPLFWIAKMDSEHMWNCTELTNVPDDITACYWETLSHMAERPQMGIG